MEYFLLIILGVIIGAVGTVLLQSRRRPAAAPPAQAIPVDPVPVEQPIQQESTAPPLYSYDPRKRHPVRRHL